MAKIRKAGRSFLNFFRSEEILPSEFMEYSNTNSIDEVRRADFYINF